MNVVDKTPPSQVETIAFEFDLHHPPQKVWRALTEPELIGQWLLSVTDFELVPGKAFLLKTQPYPGWDGVVHCRMLEVEPHEKLSYAWVVGDMELDTVVTFTLEPTPTGTRLRVVQSGFDPAQKKESGGARYGWTMMGGKLGELLATMP